MKYSFNFCHGSRTVGFSTFDHIRRGSFARAAALRYIHILDLSSLRVANHPAVTFVPYRGAPQGLQDLIAGRIDYYCPVIAAGMPQILLK